MSLDKFYYYDVPLLVAILSVLLARGYLNQYKLSGRISEYYTAIGSFLFSISCFAYFIDLTINPNKNIEWLSIILFLIIPAGIFITGEIIRAIVYGYDNRPPLLYRLRLIFGIPKGERINTKIFKRKDLLYLGITGYAIALILSSVYSPKDFLIITMAFLSELFLVIAPLPPKLTN